MKNTTSITRRMQARPELTRGGAPWLRYKKLAFSLALAAGSLSVAGVASAAGGVAAGAGPTGGTVVGGIGSITQNGASTVINQQSKLLSLNWQSFNVGKDASVLFNQPSFNAVALNRILDQSPSQIFGRINSNGQIFLINTHGIIFGSSAQLNVGGLVASTLDLTPDDFLKGHFNLDAHGGHAGIVNQGTIAAASGGSVSLIGGHVENDGLIVANYGRINLDGADKAVLDFDGDGLVNIQITGALEQRLDTEQAAIANKGTLRANGGTVVLQASAAKDLFTDLVNNSGVIDAQGISTDGGVVRLVGNGGNTVNSGSIDVSGVHGGSAQLLSDQNVGVTGGSINASGAQGGGSIRVGGGWQGGEGLQTASATYVAPDATLKADATQSGNGGSVVVWGNNANNFYGSISARGGAGGGNGGRVETSAHYGLNAQGVVDASAPRGSNGTWLLDPYDVIIGTTAGGTAWANPYTPTATSTIKASNVGSALTGGTNVFVFTNTAANGTDTGNITLSAPISAAGKGSLYLEAVGSILLDSTITAKNTSNPINVYLWANYGGAAAGTIYSSNAACATCQVIIGDTASAGIATDGGGVDIRTGDATHAGGSVQLGSSATVTGSIDTGGGTLNVIANGIGQQATGASTITAGSASLAAGAGAINLLNGGNDFTGTVNLSNSGTNDVALDNGSNALTLGNVVVGTGALSLSGTGLSQVAATAITQGAGAGAVTLNGGAGAISLANGGNDFTGTVSVGNSGANNVALNNGSNALTLGNVAVGTGTLSLGGTGLSQAAATAITQSAGAGAVTLNGGAGAISLGNSGNDFTGTVNVSTSGANNVALNNGSNALTLGSASVGGSLDVASSGGITLTQNVSSGAAQTYENAVTLGGDVIAASTGSGAIDFVSTVDGAHNLAVNTGGLTTFGGTVGGTTALTSLATDSGGSTTLAADVTTTGNQTYGDALGLSNAATTLTGSTVDVEGGAGGSSSALTIVGNAVLKGSSSLSSLSVSGTSSLQGSISTSGTQTFTGAATLTGDTTLVSTGSGASGVIGFDDLVDGSANLGITSTAGSVSFAKAVGSVTPLGSLSVNAGSISLGGDVTTSGIQDFTGALSFGNTSTTLAGSTVTLNNALSQATENLTITGDGAFGSTVDLASLDVSGKTSLASDVTTSGTQTYNGAVTLGNDVKAASSGNGAIAFNSTVDGAHNLVVNTGGQTTFGGAVGGTTALTSLTTDSTGSTTLGGNITTTGAQTYNDAVTLTGNAAATSTGGAAITLNSTIDGAHTLAVNTAGATTFGGAVGGTTALTSLTTDAGGSTTLDSSVNTTGAQTYNDAVALGTDVT
ncbi:MAG TPA: filamentous hemagglutinin N-terminal domain-containing protein, partial [Rhodanobacteraceae bacterium]|nr:filamentous hemagglutinin N-terminal domain-containing protein [Rhodanobacteraceae bacterium]